MGNISTEFEVCMASAMDYEPNDNDRQTDRQLRSVLRYMGGL